MPGDTRGSSERIEKQVVILRDLAEELAASIGTCENMDLDEIYRHLSKQVWLCDQLQELGRDIPTEAPGLELEAAPAEAALHSWMTEIEPEIAQSLGRVLAELAATEGQVRNIHRARAVLTAGSRRTLNILTNAVAMLSLVFPAAGVTANQPSSQPRKTAQA
jgi:hypothetical protein